MMLRLVPYADGEYLLAHTGTHATVSRTIDGAATARTAPAHVTADPIVATAVHRAAAGETSHRLSAATRQRAGSAAETKDCAIARKRAARSDVSSTHQVAVRTLPLHGVARTTDVSGLVTEAAAVTTSPDAQAEIVRLWRSFTCGLVTAIVTEEARGQITVKALNRWFQARSSPEDLLFSATGEVRNGRFFPRPYGGGPVTILQGAFRPAEGFIVEARLITNVRSLSKPLTRAHRVSGITLYVADESRNKADTCALKS